MVPHNPRTRGHTLPRVGARLRADDEPFSSHGDTRDARCAFTHDEGRRCAVCQLLQSEVRSNRDLVERTIPCRPDPRREVLTDLSQIYRAESGPCVDGLRSGRLSLVELRDPRHGRIVALDRAAPRVSDAWDQPKGPTSSLSCDLRDAIAGGYGATLSTRSPRLRGVSRGRGGPRRV